jgi:hypothetical protein
MGRELRKSIAETSCQQRWWMEVMMVGFSGELRYP